MSERGGQEIDEIERHLERGDLSHAQRLLARLREDVQAVPTVSYLATRLLYQRGQLSPEEVRERLRSLMIDGEVPQSAVDMLSAAESGTLTSKYPTAPPGRPSQRVTVPAAEDGSAGRASPAPPPLIVASGAAGPSVLDLPVPVVPGRAIGKIRPRGPSIRRVGAQSAPPEGSHSLGEKVAALLAKEQFSEALEQLSAVVTGLAARLLLLKAKAHRGLGQRNESVAALRAVAVAAEVSPSEAAQSVHELLRLGVVDLALQQARRVHDRFPTARTTQVARACAETWLARLEGQAAPIELVRLLVRGSTTAAGEDAALPVALSAYAEASAGETDVALDLAKKALSLNANSIDALAALAVAASRNQDPEQARRALEQLERLEPEQALATRRFIDSLPAAPEQTQDSEARLIHAPTPIAAPDMEASIETWLLAGRYEPAAEQLEQMAERRLDYLKRRGRTSELQSTAVVAATFLTTAPVWREFVPYDLSLHSVRRIAAAIMLLYPKPTRVDKGSAREAFAHLLASYVGECVRRAHRGHWTGSFSDFEQLSVCVGKVTFRPFVEVQRRLETGLAAALLPTELLTPDKVATEFRVIPPVDPPCPWERDWPSLNEVVELGQRSAHSVLGLHCETSTLRRFEHSLATFSALDDFLALIAPERANADPGAVWARRSAVLIGSHLGECLRREFGGSWQELNAEKDARRYGLALGDWTLVMPIAEVLERLEGQNQTPLEDLARRVAGRVQRR